MVDVSPMDGQQQFTINVIQDHPARLLNGCYLRNCIKHLSPWISKGYICIYGGCFPYGWSTAVHNKCHTRSPS